MQKFFYYLSLPIIYFFSILPFPVLYFYSNICFFVIYHVIGYRKNVVSNNLQNAFPEKSPQEIQKITKKFYRHLCDVLFETIKLFTISKKQLLKRCTFKNSEILEKYYNEGKHVILTLGHYGNWELGGLVLPLLIQNTAYTLYKPLSNSYYDKLMQKMRSRFGTKLISMQESLRKIISISRTKDYSIIAFIADQTPMPESAFWFDFLNQDTPVFKGAEQIARKLDLPVVFASIRKIKRGFYEVHYFSITENSEVTDEMEITKKFTNKLEKEIVKEPAFWLWSHKRWKHKREKRLI